MLNGLEDESDLKHRIESLKEIELETSNSSFLIEDIVSFTLGPSTSRFWAYRKYINELASLKDAPFCAWNCITFHLRESKGDVYLVINNQNNLKKLLYYLIYSMKTLDGRRDSAKGLIR